MALLDLSHPLRSLTFIFTAWKSFLLAIALAASISPDYDTSTNLFLTRLYPNASSSSSSSTALLANQLTRWDALYFIHAAKLGAKLYEQEYAFGTGLSTTIRSLQPLVTRVLGQDGDLIFWEPLAGIAIAHVTHLGSVIALYKLTALIFRPSSRENHHQHQFAFTASILHILSPGGLFLSAPYAESPFSCLSFLGSYLFALGYHDANGSTSTTNIPRSASIVAAGAVFGLATWFRSNGLACGLLFAVETLRSLNVLLLRGPTLSSLLAVLAPVMGGMFVGAGSAVPQYLAWVRFCAAGATGRPWCSETLPSIYSFVQEHYWNVGFLRYWTPNQIPLFLLAAPVLSILTISGLHFLQSPPSTGPAGINPRFMIFVRTTAAIQTVVAVLAFTSYHVQIINRLASGYFVWYWWIAGCMIDTKRQGLGWGVTVFMVMYASIQGALYASFLPPA